MGNRLATNCVEISKDPADLSKPGFWVVVNTFEGDWFCARFTDVQDAPLPISPWAGIDGKWHSSQSQTSYEANVHQIKELIAKGEIYQVNLCRVLSNDCDQSLLGLANLLQKSNPAPYASYLSLPGLEIASASPELFLQRSGDQIKSTPIKGTALEDNFGEKDKAENVMIVDLVRNDLSQVCQTGSVKVPSLLETQVHPGLVHLVSTVEGQLKEEITWTEIFDATFPPGSVSGAPKISALNLIKKYEKSARGPYCGAIGWINTFNDTALIAVGIRTFWKDKNQLLFGTGAGITWGSEPLKEWQETELKCAKLFEVASKTHSK